MKAGNDKIPLIFRQTQSNAFTIPVLLNAIENLPVAAYFSVSPACSFDELIAKIPEHSRALIAYSFMTPHLPETIAETRKIRKKYGEKIILMAGGPHANGNPESLKNTDFNYIACGEGESTLPFILRDFLNAKLSKTSVIIKNDKPANLDKSFPIAKNLAMMSPLELTRGCCWKCRFCQTGQEKPRHRSLESVKKYIAEMKERNYLFRSGFIAPGGLEYGADRPGEIRLDIIEKLLDLYKKAGIRHIEYGIFPSELRPNTVSAEGLKIIKKYCSNKKVTIGAQSGCDGTLQKLNRGHATADIEKSACLAHQAGFIPVLDFILGFPEETEAEQMETLRFVEYLHAKYLIRAQMHFFMPLSGTPLEKQMPAFISGKIETILQKYYQNGICTNWWKKGMELSRKIIRTRETLQI